MTEHLFGKFFSMLFWEMLFADGIQLFTKFRKYMKIIL